MMIDEAGNTIHRHRTGTIVLHINVSEKLIRYSTCDSQNTINVRFVLFDPCIGESRQLVVIISQVPYIKALRIRRPHFTGNHIGLVAILSPRFLITKNLIILSIALSKDLLVLDSLFTDVSENGPVEIKLVTARPKTVEALLIGVVITSNHYTDNQTVLCEGLREVRVLISSKRLTNNSTLRSSAGLSTGLLNDLIDIDRNTITAKILRTLQASIRGSHTEERPDNLSIARTTTGLSLIEFLNLESKPKLIDRSGNSATIKLTNKTRISGRNRTKLTKAESLMINIRISQLLLILDNSANSMTTLHNIDHKTARISTIESEITERRRTKTEHHSVPVTIDRNISTTNQRDGYIRAFLRGGKGTGEVIVILGSNKGLTAFSNICHNSASVDTGHGTIVRGHNKRVLQILVTEPLVHDQSIGPERQSRHRETSNASRDAKIVSKSSNIPSFISRTCNLGHRVLSLRNPCAFRVLTTELLPMIPNKAIGDKEIIGIQIHVVHHRG